MRKSEQKTTPDPTPTPETFDWVPIFTDYQKHGNKNKAVKAIVKAASVSTRRAVSIFHELNFITR